MTRLSSRRGLRGFRRLRRSFTLVELAVTVAILGILCGVVIDSGIREWRHAQVSTVLLQLSGWLETVRRSAVKGNSCTVTIRSGHYGNGDQLATISTPSAPQGPCGTVGPFRLIGVSHSPGFTVSTPEPTTTITFTPAGTIFRDPDPQTPIVISVQLNDANPDPKRCLMLEGMLGLIDVGISRGSSCVIGEGF